MLSFHVMLEIIFLIWFSKKLAATAAKKNRSKAWGALSMLWVVGEVTAIVVATRDHAPLTGEVYGLAVLFAVLGAAAAWIIVKALPALPPPDFPAARVVDPD